MTRDDGRRELEAGTIHADGALSDLKPGRVLAILIDFITPEILQRRKPLTRRLGSTAWLDGLRGCAAFSVCLVHLTVYTHAGLEQCYGSELPGDQKTLNTSPIVLPFIRLPFLGGHFAVMLFFTISGYVVPRRMLQCLHEGHRDDFLAAAQSSVIRRPVRLYLPVVLSTFLLASAWHILGIQTPWPEHQGNIVAELWNWIKEMLVFLYFFRVGLLYTNYNFHTWTIPVEFRGSMFLVVWLFALHTIKTRTRVLLTLGMTLYLALGTPGAWYASFFAGMLMSELDLVASETSCSAVGFPWDGFNKWFKSRRLLRTFTLDAMLIFGFYLGSEPSSDFLTKEQVLGSCRGWKTLSQLIPDAYSDKFSHHRWFWLFWGSWITLYATKEIDWMRWALETRPAQCKGTHIHCRVFIVRERIHTNNQIL